VELSVDINRLNYRLSVTILAITSCASFRKPRSDKTMACDGQTWRKAAGVLQTGQRRAAAKVEVMTNIFWQNEPNLEAAGCHWTDAGPLMSR
jgi:hypothetical protein